MANIFVREALKESFVDYLRRQGYPDNQIVLDWGDGTFHVDIAIMADDLKTPLSIYEVRDGISINETREIAEKVSNYSRKQGITIPVYIVFPDTKLQGQFEILNLADRMYQLNQPFDADTFIKNTTKTVQSYDFLKNGAEIKLATQKQKKKEKRIDKIKPICWGLIPVIGIALLILDAFGIYQFSTERLIVLGIILVVVLLPFFSEISLGDVSVKRKKEDKEK